MRTNLTKILVLLTIFLLVLTIPVEADGYKPFIQQPTQSSTDISTVDQSSTNLFSGSTTYNYPLEVPKGVNNLQPNLMIFYNHQSLSPIPTLLGHGWDISQNYISRDTEYTQTDISDDSYFLNFNGIKEKLIYVSSEGRYHTQSESFLYIKKLTGGNNQNNEYWEVKTKDGTVYRFGYNQDSELASNLENYIVHWNLDKIKDVSDNQVLFTYLENNGMSYIDEINYGNNKIEFSYSLGTLSPRTLFVQGNKIEPDSVLTSVSVKNNNGLVREYHLDYEQFGSYALLTEISLFGNDGLSNLPSTTFDYYEPEVGFQLNNNLKLPTYFGEDEDLGVRIVDKNYDGLMDVIKIDNDEDLESWLNTGNGWENQPEIINFLDGGIVDNDGNDQGVRFGFLNEDRRIDIIKLVSGDENKRLVKIMDVLNNWHGSYAGGIPSPLNFIYYDDDPADISCPNNYGLDEGPYCDEYEGSCYIKCAKWKCWGWDGQYAGSCTGGPGCCPGGTTPDKDVETEYFDYSDLVISDDEGTRLVDLNGDGLSDFIVGRKGEAKKTYLTNSISSFTSANNWNVPSGAEFINENNVDLGVQLVDVNGDSLIDLVKGNGNSRITWLNNGNGWTLDADWKIPSGAIFIDENKKEGVVFAEINGDGLIDILRKKGSAELVWLNNGNGWTYSSEWATEVPGGFTLDEYGTQILDINGDGVSDIVHAESSNDKATWINKAQKAYLLKEVENSNGGTIGFDYEKSTSFDNTGSDSISDLGFNLWTVSEVTYNNGMSGSQSNEFTTNYDYSGGYYDYMDKEFRGFAEVEEVKQDGTKVKHYFHQDNTKNGMEYKTEISDLNNQILKKVENTWSSQSTNGYYILKLSGTKEHAYSGLFTNPKVKEITYLYDSYGNPTFINNKGDVATTSDDRAGFTQYVYNTNDWIVNKPKITYSLFNNLQEIQETKYYYDSQVYGQISNKGRLTKTKELISGLNYKDTNFVYDTFGNVVEEIDDNGHSTEYVYDSSHVFPVEVTNDLSQTTEYEYDYGTGNLLSETDPNGYTTSYHYDVFGRKTKEIHPYDSSYYPTVEYQYSFDGNAPEKVVEKHREVSIQSGTYDIYSFYDGFGNLIQTKSDAENNKQTINDFSYDHSNRIKEESNPYLSTKSISYKTPLNVPKTTYTYDSLSRITSVENPDGTEVESVYNQWKVYVYDENNNRKDYWSDAHGNIIKVKEYNGNQIYETDYEYREDNSLLEITDDQNNHFYFEYDNLGRMTALDDPDLGDWTYVYDKVGNLLEQEDDEGNTIVMEYDSLNRLTEKSSNSGVVTYQYDIGTIGTLSSVDSDDYSVEYDYDQRLRVVDEEKTIGTTSFSSDYEYDAMGRLIETGLVGPDIQYEYNSQNLLESIDFSSSVIDDFDYNANNQVTLRSYDNNLNTLMDYDSDNFRLEEIKTGTKQELDYGYDDVGNVISIDDQKNNAALSMEYDDLDRLESAERVSAERVSAENPFTSGYNYDSIGNILTINLNGGQYLFNYQSGPVHSPSAVSAPIVIQEEGCQYDNPVCGDDYNCVNNQCVLKTGCAYNNPGCGVDSDCVNNQCVLKEGCQYDNPGCEEGFNCENNQCVSISINCDKGYIGEPSCNGLNVYQNFQKEDCSIYYAFKQGCGLTGCADGVCLEVEQGCQYNNPSCGVDSDCVNNQCVLKTGCAYNNPSCANGETCYQNECVSEGAWIIVDDISDPCEYVTTQPLPEPNYATIQECVDVYMVDHQCIDSDGNDVYTLGTTTQDFGEDFVINEMDSCYSSSKVEEWTCEAVTSPEYPGLQIIVATSKIISCPGDGICSNGVCQLQQGCQYDNPSCGEGFDCVNNECVEVCNEGFIGLPFCTGNSVTQHYMETDCSFSLELLEGCGQDKTCSGGSCILNEGCQYNNPSCGIDSDCVNNECVLKTGCQYDNPSCGEGYNCENNQCVEIDLCNCAEDEVCYNNECITKAGCQYDNPACPYGWSCVDNTCELIACYSNSDCGQPYYSNIYGCSNDKVINPLISYLCLSPGTAEAECKEYSNHFTVVEECSDGCNEGMCIADAPPYLDSYFKFVFSMDYPTKHDVDLNKLIVDDETDDLVFSITKQPDHQLIEGCSINNGDYLTCGKNKKSGKTKVQVSAEDEAGNVFVATFDIIIHPIGYYDLIHAKPVITTHQLKVRKITDFLLDEGSRKKFTSARRRSSR